MRTHVYLVIRHGKGYGTGGKTMFKSHLENCYKELVFATI